MTHDSSYNHSSHNDSSQADPLQAIISGSLGPLSRLRETIDLTLDQVSAWIADPDNRSRISNLVELLDAQTQLIICQHRLVAVARLSDVVQSNASPETIRRACADLLKLRLIDPYKEDRRPVKLRPVEPFGDDEDILEAMEYLERRDRAAMNGLEPPPIPEPLMRRRLAAEAQRAASGADGDQEQAAAFDPQTFASDDDWRAQTNIADR